MPRPVGGDRSHGATFFPSKEQNRSVPFNGVDISQSLYLDLEVMKKLTLWPFTSIKSSEEEFR